MAIKHWTVHSLLLLLSYVIWSCWIVPFKSLVIWVYIVFFCIMSHVFQMYIKYIIVFLEMRFIQLSNSWIYTLQMCLVSIVHFILLWNLYCWVISIKLIQLVLTCSLYYRILHELSFNINFYGTSWGILFREPFASLISITKQIS